VRHHSYLSAFAILVCSSLALAQAPADTTSSNPKASSQGTDSKEPVKKKSTPKTSTQGTDSKEAAKPASKPDTSFQGTDSKEPAKPTTAPATSQGH
jgi:hypothetical protein